MESDRKLFRRLIREALAALPDGYSREDALIAVNLMRSKKGVSATHRRLLWNRERSNALRTFAVLRTGPDVVWTLDDRFWIRVKCTHCDSYLMRVPSKIKGGCFLCCRHREILATRLAHPDFAQLLSGARASRDVVALAIVGDWLDDQQVDTLGLSDARRAKWMEATT